MEYELEKEIKVVVIADNAGELLKPLTDTTNVAMLPIGGKPLIEHVLESLIPLSVREVQLLVCSFAGQVREFVGSGERWGMNITYTTTRGNTDAAKFIDQERPDNECSYLILDASVFRSFEIKEALQQMCLVNKPSVLGMLNEVDVGVYFFDSVRAARLSVAKHGFAKVQLHMEHCTRISSLESYLASNMAVVRYRYNGILLRGKEISPGLVAGSRSIVDSGNLEYGEMLVGEGCRLEKSVQCKGSVLVGNNVIVDRHTRISNSVILDNTFVGERLNIENAILWRNTYIRVDLGTSLTLNDNQLISGLTETAFLSQFTGVVGRMVAGIILLLLIPAWLFAFFDAFTKNGLKPIERIRILGSARHKGQNQNQINSFRIRCRNSTLSKLPFLINVFLGELNWFGVSICRPDDLAGRSEPWQFIRDEYPVGILGPAQIELNCQSSIDDILMADATFLATDRLALVKRGLMKFLRLNYLCSGQSKVSSR